MLSLCGKHVECAVSGNIAQLLPEGQYIRLSTPALCKAMEHMVSRCSENDKLQDTVEHCSTGCLTN